MIDCGSLIFTNDLIHEGIKKRNSGRRTEDIIGTEFGAVETRFISPPFSFDSYYHTNCWINSMEQNVRDDLEWLKHAPLIRKELGERARGVVYDIKTGRVHEV